MGTGLTARSLVVVTFVLALLTPAPLRAQGMGLGIIGGVLRSEVNSGGDESQNVVLEHRSHPTGGLFLTVPLSASSGFSIQPEVLLSVKGTQWNTAALEGSLRLTYLDVPVLLRYAGPPGARARIHVFGGPSVGFLLHATSEVERPASANIDVKDRYKGLDLGWVVGIGVGGGRLRADLRYGGSIAEITGEPELGGGAPPPMAGADSGFRNRAFQLLASVSLF